MNQEKIGKFIASCRKEQGFTQTARYPNGKPEFPIVKDTTPNITNSRLNNIP